MNTMVVALQKEGKAINATYEAIEAAKALGGDIFTLIMAADASAAAGELASRGGGKILAVSDASLANFNDEAYANVLAEMIKKYNPKVVLCPATLYGRALMSRCAGSMSAPAVTDITAISAEGDAVSVTRPSYGGSVIETVAPAADDKPFFVTVRPKIFAESKDGSGEVVTETVDAACFATQAKVTDVKSESGGSQNLAEADVIVSAGRGIKGHENVDLIKGLADAVGGAFGASRAAVDAGWVPYATQVGQTGKTVNPKLYIAVGISGAIQHLVGMQSANTIVAINKDKDAPIFNVANYGIVGDLFEIVPALTKKFAAELGN